LTKNPLSKYLLPSLSGKLSKTVSLETSGKKGNAKDEITMFKPKILNFSKKDKSPPELIREK
jgi:hypothetical protein